jgi:pyruvate,water dikinase
MSNQVTFITDLTKLDVDNLEVGNKAANLGKLIKYKFSVPKGFVIKTNAYNDFVSFNNLDDIIQDSLAKLKYDSDESIEKCSQTIQDSIENSKFSSELVNELELKL